jgi:hypothetical protein
MAVELGSNLLMQAKLTTRAPHLWPTEFLMATCRWATSYRGDWSRSDQRDSAVAPT